MEAKNRKEWEEERGESRHQENAHFQAVTKEGLRDPNLRRQNQDSRQTSVARVKD